MNNFTISMPTGRVIDGKEEFKDIDINDKTKNQLFFEFKNQDPRTYIALQFILECLAFAEKNKAVSPLPKDWWDQNNINI